MARPMSTRLPSAAMQSGSSAPGLWAWGVVGLCWLIFFLNQADRQVIFSVFPLVKTELGLSDVQLGLLGSAFFWVYGLLVPLAGGIGDTANRKLVVVVSLCVWSAATALSSTATGLLTLALFRALTAAGEAFYYPAAASLLSSIHGERTRATALSVHQTANYLGVLASGGAAGYVGQHYGWRMAFLMFGGAGIVVALVAWRGLRDPDRARSTGIRFQVPAREQWLRVLAIPTLRLHALAFLAMVFALTSYQAWMPTLLYRNFGLDLASAGFFATVWHYTGAMVGALAGGRIADRFSAESVCFRPRVQALGLLCGAPFIWIAGWSSSLHVVYAALGFYGFFRGVYDSNLFASPFSVVPAELRGTATGLLLAVGFLGGGLGPLLTGRLSDAFGLGFALSLSGYAYLAGALVLYIDQRFCFGSSLRHSLSMEGQA